MRLVIQECQNAKVEVENKIVGQIDFGEMVLVGFKPNDDKKIVDKMIDKMLKLRIFPDENGKTNLSLEKFGGNILAVSQFTLYGNLKEGNRPSYCTSMPADEARNLFEYFKGKLLEKWPQAQFGIFQADMLVSFTNVGPSTFILDSEELFNE